MFRGKKKRVFAAAPAVVFIAVLLFLSLLCGVFFRQLVIQKHERALATAANEASTVHDRFDIMFSRGYLLSTLVISHNGDTAWFDDIAPLIYNEAYTSSRIALKNISLAPGGVVSKVYPMRGNDKLLGFSFMDDSQPGNAEALMALDKRTMTLTNPFSLMQGGTGMGSRSPIFIESEEGQYFWGFATITINFDDLLDELDLPALEQSGYDYHLWYDDDNGQRTTIASSPHLPNYPISQEVILSNLTWHLDIAPRDGWIDKTLFGLIALLIFLIALVAARSQSAHNDVKRVNLHLELLAQMDALSGCYSRQFINMSLIDPETGAWKDPDAKYSVLMVDIDNFKKFNDEYGHEAGDLVIVEVAHMLQNSCKDETGNCIIRYGGDEFIMLLNNVEYDRFQSIAGNVLKQARQLAIPKIPELEITLSIGGSYFNAAESNDFYAQIKDADECMYQAKTSGRDRCVLK